MAVTDSEQPQPERQATEQDELEGFYCPGHPHASPKSGWVPPRKSQFPEGVSGNTKGNAKSFSIRNAARRRLSTNKVDGIGEEAWLYASALIEAASIGDQERVDAIVKLIHEVEGRPQEHREVTGSEKTIVIHAPFKGEPPEPPAETDGP